MGNQHGRWAFSWSPVWPAGYRKATIGVNGLVAITAAMTVFAASALLFAVWHSFEAPQELAETLPIV